jgi:hypothetical protein
MAAGRTGSLEIGDETKGSSTRAPSRRENEEPRLRRRSNEADETTTNEAHSSQLRHPGASRGPSRTDGQARAWCRGSRPLAPNKASVPINTMDPGFRRGDGRERATKAATPSLWRVGYPRNTPRLIGSGVRESEARFTRDLTRTRIPREGGNPGAGHCTPAPWKGSAVLLGPRFRGGRRKVEKRRFNFIPLIQEGASPTIPMDPACAEVTARRTTDLPCPRAIMR